MLTNYEALPDQTRVWIYQSNQPIEEQLVAEINTHIQHFVQQWVSHNNALQAYGTLLHRRFVVLMVDETRAGASGCSIDKSVHFVKALEKKYGLDLFDRMSFSYMDGEEIKTAAREEFSRLYQSGQINDQTLVFDNLVKNKEELESRWVKPLKDSWHSQLF